MRTGFTNNSVFITNFAPLLNFLPNSSLSEIFYLYKKTHSKINSPKTFDIESRALNLLFHYTKKTHLQEFSKLDVLNFINERLVDGHSPTYINIHLRALRTIFNFAIENKLITLNPFSKMKAKCSDKKPVYMKKEEIAKFLSVAPEWLKDVVQFDIYTGLRRAELVNLRWCDYNEELKTITIESHDNFTTKHGKARTISLHSEAINIIQKQNKNCKYIFNKNGIKLSEDNITHKFYKYRIKAGLNKDLHFHSLRHTFASYLAMAGVPIFMIKEFLGHSTIKMTEVYAHLEPNKLHTEVEKISIL